MITNFATHVINFRFESRIFLSNSLDIGFLFIALIFSVFCVFPHITYILRILVLLILRKCIKICSLPVIYNFTKNLRIDSIVQEGAQEANAIPWNRSVAIKITDRRQRSHREKRKRTLDA